MKKLFAVMAIAMALSIAFTIGYSVGKDNVQSQPVAWADSTGEVYYQK